MPGNTFGKYFTLTSCGESHGPALAAIVDGCPPGLLLTEDDLQADIERRRSGTSRHTSQRREPDQVRIISGVFEGRTTGAPIGLLIENTDAKSKDYADIKDRFRPGHADYTWQQKYGFRDYRGGGRSSARETVMRVAAGAIARKLLGERWNVSVRACLSGLGPIELPIDDWSQVDANPFFAANAGMVDELEAFMDQLRRDGDSAGARVHVEALGLPAGWGEPVFDKLDADIAHAMMGINAVKGVGVGDGMNVATQRGSEHRDELTPSGFLSNHSGGTLGGISTGQAISVDVAFKPTSSIRIPGKSIDADGKPVEVVTTGRHDPCVGIRGVPVCEAMLALVLVDHALRHRAQNADVVKSLDDIPGSAGEEQ